MAATHTNTVIVECPAQYFVDRSLREELHTFFKSFGAVHKYISFPSILRIIVVYDDSECVASVFETQPPAFLPHIKYGPPLPVPLYEPDLLSVPQTERNFLISPPGSPPVGWVQTVEDPPNTEALSADGSSFDAQLIKALESFSAISLGQEISAGAGPVQSLDPVVILVPDENSDDDALPSITLSAPESSATHSPGFQPLAPPPGAGHITSVKATVDSMAGSFVPTAMPPR